MNTRQVRAGVPSYPGMVKRQALHRVLGCGPRGLVLVAAPAGYGKTVLASQVVATLDCSAVWIQLRGEPVDSAQLFQAMCLEMQRWGGCHSMSEGGLGVPCQERVCSAVTNARPLILVLDDVGANTSPQDLVASITRLRASGPSPDVVIVTTRADSTDWIADCSPDVVVGVDGLAFSESETAEAMRLQCGRAMGDDLVDTVLELSRGHAATTAVLARQMVLDPLGSGAPNMDLNAHLTLLARSQLDERAMPTLCALSMLSSGSVASLESFVGRSVRGDLRRIASRIPLVQYPLGDARSTFGVHELASSVYGSREFVDAARLDYNNMLEQALRVLDERSDYLRLFQVVDGACDAGLAERVLLRHGRELLAIGGLDLLTSVLELVPTRRMLLLPRLLLLQAEALREKMCFEEALGKAAVARDLAGIEDDHHALAEALLLLARLQLDRGLVGEAIESLRRILEVREIGDETRVTVASYLSVAHAFLGEREAAMTSARLADDSRARSVGPMARARIAIARATISALVDGRWADALDQLVKARAADCLPLLLSIQYEGNIGTALIETGRIDRGAAALEMAIAASERHGLRMLELSYRDSLALAHAAKGDYDIARDLLEDAIHGCVELGDRMEVSRQYAYMAMFSRAAGWLDESLQAAERAMEEAANLQCPWLRWMGSLEVAASLLALGDNITAGRQAEWVRAEAAHLGSNRYGLTADLILAVGDSRAEDIESAVARLAIHEDLIRDGHSNFLLIMYVRAFPQLLPVLASLPDGVPHGVMCNTPRDTMRNALAICVRQGWGYAGQQLSQTEVELLAEGRAPSCQVRLFGGLEVRVGDRSVRERDWKKRKARLLFALMVLERGRDLPREQVCDQLWPNLDADRAKNNFYVIWSIMKCALLPGGTKGAPLPYADNTGGLCRIDVERVDSDVEQFSRTISSARAAENAGELTAAVGFYRSAMDIYRGELLPGDIYDDCFALARDRYRLEFCDAMRRAVSCAERIADPAEALDFARRGLDADPLSEDLYQAVMRSHIDAGQRSAAIETYFVCRQKLCDDLGLDPSSETMKLYEHILAMDDPTETDSAL
ncbi:MAG: BTAD domain-containing putative transcriptional regulator [Coriobacteriia bacterium]|nr:BTAD domain-containing putative transcriptional regulator [Coriobacteriia bacterium]